MNMNSTSHTEPLGPPLPDADLTREESVVACYGVLHRIFGAAGLSDLTDGIYPTGGTSYEDTQALQAEYLLDEARVGRSSRVLDVGCGYGRLLRAARERGASAIGISISPEQVESCRRQGLAVDLLNYRDMHLRWRDRFEAVVANGSLEHFARPAEAARGSDDDVYRGFFERCHQVSRPGARLVTTAIHFAHPIDPRAIMDWTPLRYSRTSEEFHFGLLERVLGGWYPLVGQLERCASGLYRLVRTVDGTEDYLRTSEQWVRGSRAALLSSAAPRLARELLGQAIRRPTHLLLSLWCGLVSQSWNWQFRGGDAAPTRLLRQTWERVPG